MKKRLIALILSLLLLLTVMPQSAVFANDMPTFYAGTVEGEQGDTVVVTVSTKNNSGIVSLKVDVGYDADRLELLSISGQDFAGTSFGPLTKNPIAVSWVDAANQNNTTNGVVAKLTFKIKETAAPGATAITLVYDAENVYNFDFDNVTFAIENGSVTILCSHTETTVVDAKDSTCQEQGNNQYTVCDKCGEVTDGSDEKLPLADHVYDNDSDVDCNVCGNIRTPVTDPAQATIDGVPYADLQDALDEARSGQTIVLSDDVDMSSKNAVIVADGVVLDLNGHQLIVSNLLAFGEVADRLEGQGKLVVSDDTSKAFVCLQPNNSQMPLYDEDGYRFFSYSVMNKGVQVVTEGEKNKYGVHVQFANRKAYELLGNEKNGNLSVVFTASYGQSSLVCTFKSNTLVTYSQLICEKYDNGVEDKTGTVMVLTVSGLSRVSDDVSISVAIGSSNTGVTSAETEIQ